ncbi:ABC transporter permease [Streptomyces sp. TS71-3]|uniref:ABC transporter permease n=1 Tax=Streptomyces sp. TS71-3 TaxID=2733862 RepID=UPI001B23D6EA|nr:ABC transporter permease [Streptomyces sp. TS71-3]GHJ37245.1 ribose ABC transporter permease [Streptomyces sp. TS71-3]
MNSPVFSALRTLARELRTVWMLVLVCVVLSFASPTFLTSTNLLNVGLATATVALLAIGQSYVIVLAEIDLSVGATLAFSAMATALVLRHHGLALGILVGLGTGAVVGLVNGLLVTRARMPSFIVTLATMSILAGLTLQISSGNPVAVTDYSFQGIGQDYLAGVPVPVWLMLVAYLVFGVLLARTGFGRFVYATGDNLEAARLSGIRTQRIKVIAFVLAGVLAALGGFVLTARLSTAEPTAGTGYELESIAAVIIGGTSLAGGRGKLLGTLIGALVLGVIDNGMNLLDVSPFLQEPVKGVVILLAVYFDRNIDSLRALTFWRNPGNPAVPTPSPSPSPSKTDPVG